MLRFRRWRLVRRRSAPALPPALRARLLGIPATRTAVRPVMASRSPADRGLTWLVASPVTPLAAGFVLALALSLAWGNPYQAGAATLARVRDQASPATAKVRGAATTLLAVATELGESAVSALPRAGFRASRAVTATLQERIHDLPANPGR